MPRKIQKKADVKGMPLATVVQAHILQFIHPYLYRIISNELTILCEKQKKSLKLPVSLIISLNSIATLEHFQNVILGYKFPYDYLSVVASTYGNFQTILWFQGQEVEMFKVNECRDDSNTNTIA
jgi:hypothetical protein